jgi:hypothetical protein
VRDAATGRVGSDNLVGQCSVGGGGNTSSLTPNSFINSARVVVQAFESFGELEAGVLQFLASRRLDPFADTLDDVTFLAASILLSVLQSAGPRFSNAALIA